MIDLLKELEIDHRECRVADIGTGSGAIGITAALEVPGLEAHLTDIDPECLTTAQANARQHNVLASFHEGDLLEPLLPFRPLPHVLLCNLPYVPDSHTINEAAMFEPKHAIFGGSDGLDLYRRLFDQIDELEEKPLFILTESLPFQHEALAAIATEHGYKQQDTRGFIQLFNY
jgi:release factor glutamine methyltransferase